VWGVFVPNTFSSAGAEVLGRAKFLAPHTSVVTEAGSYLRRTDFGITQLKAQGPSRTCNERKEEEEEAAQHLMGNPKPSTV